jgi:hypothetical protein
VIAAVWDAPGQRWLRVEPEVGPGHVAAIDGSVVDVSDVAPHLFLTGGEAWQRVRSGALDAESFVVAPELLIPATRGWPYLRHNLVHDLAAMNKQEMLLWDDWGVLDEPLPTGLPPAADRLEVFDRLAEVLTRPSPPAQEVRRWAALDGFAVPETVTSYSPVHERPLKVDVSRVVAGR